MIYKIPQRKNIFESIYSILSKPISRVLIPTCLTANHVTIISGIFGIVGAYFLTLASEKDLLSAAIFIQLYTIFDLVDGDIARAKNLQSHFGKWLDVSFDKLNDLLIIYCFSIGVFKRTNNLSSLYLGMLLMGLVFFIQFSMLIHSNIHKEAFEEKRDDVNLTNEKKKIYQPITYLNLVRKIFAKHLLLEHCTFLFLITFFCVVNKTEFGLWFLVAHSTITLIYIKLASGIVIFSYRNKK